jgi:hypothetical protein
MTSLKILGLLAGVCVAAVVTGCGAPSSSSSSRPHGSASNLPDDVTVDFFAGGKLSAACTGTLLSPNVVLTAAHCADGSKGARVTAPSVGGARAEVSEILKYDWGTRKSHGGEHDLALLVLRTPIHAASYATVDTNACRGCNVFAYGRQSDGIRVSAVTALETRAPQGHPFALRFSNDASGAGDGGAVRSSSGSIVGVFSGRGASSGRGYLARVDTPNVQLWLRAAVSANGGSMSIVTAQGGSGASAPTNFIHTKNTGGVSSGNQGSSTGEDQPSDDSDIPDEDVTPSEDPSPTPDSETDDKPPSDYDAQSKLTTASVDGKAPDGNVRTQGDNYWFSNKPNDPAFENDKAYADGHPDATLVGAHGAPGEMEDAPDAATMKSLTNGKDGPLVVDSCFAGAKPDQGDSNAAALADMAGVDRSQAYGCTGEEFTPDDGTLGCAGSWVDGNGDPVPENVRGQYNMQNCDPTRDEDGNITDVSCDSPTSD